MAEILCENDNFAIKQEIKTMKKNIFKFFYIQVFLSFTRGR